MGSNFKNLRGISGLRFLFTLCQTGIGTDSWPIR
jgi:hypothetical protein